MQTARRNTWAVIPRRQLRRGRTTSKLSASGALSTSSRPRGPRAPARAQAQAQAHCSADTGDPHDEQQDKTRCFDQQTGITFAEQEVEAVGNLGGSNGHERRASRPRYGGTVGETDTRPKAFMNELIR